MAHTNYSRSTNEDGSIQIWRNESYSSNEWAPTIQMGTNIYTTIGQNICIGDIPAPPKPIPASWQWGGVVIGYILAAYICCKLGRIWGERLFEKHNKTL